MRDFRFTQKLKLASRELAGAAVVHSISYKLSHIIVIGVDGRCAPGQSQTSISSYYDCTFN